MLEGEKIHIVPVSEMDTDQLRAELDIVQPLPGDNPEGVVAYNNAMSALVMGKATREQRALVARAEDIKEALARPYDTIR